MDKFGDFVDRPAVSSSDATKIFVSSTFSEFGALRRLLQGLPDTLEVPVEIYNLGNFRYGTEEWKARVKSADLILLLLGNSVGPTPPNGKKSYLELDYAEAIRHGAEAIIYKELDSPDIALEGSMAAFRAELEPKHIVTELDQLGAVLQFEMIHDRLAKWLAESRRAQQRRTLTALGDSVLVADDYSWRDFRINDLDQWVFGFPAKREPKKDDDAKVSALVKQADDAWNETASSFKLRHGGLMQVQLDRVAEIRPLDGENRYWLGRLAMMAAASQARWDLDEWKTVLSHFEAATRIHADEGPTSGKTGLCHLMQAKTLRNMGRRGPAQRQVTEAMKLIGWHSEIHLEACYLELAAGRSAAAQDHLRDAFYKYPPSYNSAREEVSELDGGSEAHDRIRPQLVDEVRAHLQEMCGFEKTISAALTHADNRNDSTVGLVSRIVPPKKTTKPKKPPTRGGKSDGPPNVLGEEARGIEQSAKIQFRENNGGILRDHSDDPVRLANRAQWLSTLNHAGLVELETRLELAYDMYNDVRTYWSELADNTLAARLNAVLVGIMCLVLAIFLGATARLTPGVTFAVMAWTIAATTFGALWWNRTKLERAEFAADRARERLKQTAINFEELIDEYEKTHTALSHYLPRVAPDYGIQPLCRLAIGTTASGNTNHDFLIPHIRTVVGSGAIDRSPRVRLYRESKLFMINAKQAERWQAYASPSGFVIDQRSRPSKPTHERPRPVPPKAK